MANPGIDPRAKTTGRYAPGKKYGAKSATNMKPLKPLAMPCDIRNWSRNPTLLTRPVASRTNILGWSPTRHREGLHMIKAFGCRPRGLVLAHQVRRCIKEACA